MSDLPHLEPLDLPAEIARIDRERAETQKLLAEARKLNSQSRKFNRDAWRLILVALLGVVAIIIARLPELLHAFGIGPP